MLGLRKGLCGSPRGAKRLVTDALATVKKLPASPAGARVLLRAASASTDTARSAPRSALARTSRSRNGRPEGEAAIAAIPADAWQAIEYTDAIFDQATQAWISTAEVAEIPFTVQKKANQIPGRLVARRIPDLKPHTGQATLLDTWRFHVRGPHKLRKSPIASKIRPNQTTAQALWVQLDDATCRAFRTRAQRGVSMPHNHLLHQGQRVGGTFAPSAPQLNGESENERAGCIL
jgi:hypothetical protein